MRWEYLVRNVRRWQWQELDAYGEAGWELVQLTDLSPEYWTGIFKRPLADGQAEDKANYLRPEE